MTYYSKIIFCFILINLIVFSTQNENNENLLCGDEKCQKVISIATTTHKYTAGSEGKISFEAGQEARIYAKYEKGNLYEIETGGSRGWAPKNSIKEQKTLVGKGKLVKVPIPDIVKKMMPKTRLQPSEFFPNISKIEEKTTPLPDKTEKKLITEIPNSKINTEEYSNTTQTQPVVTDIIISEEKNHSYNQNINEALNTTSKGEAIENSIEKSTQQLNHSENLERKENNLENITKTEDKVKNDHLKVAKSNQCASKLNFLHIIESINPNKCPKKETIHQDQYQEQKSNSNEERNEKNENVTKETELKNENISIKNKFENENTANNLNEENQEAVNNNEYLNTESNLTNNKEINNSFYLSPTTGAKHNEIISSTTSVNDTGSINSSEKNETFTSELELKANVTEIEHEEVVLSTTIGYATDNTYNKKENETITSESELKANVTEIEYEEVVLSTTIGYDTDNTYNKKENETITSESELKANVTEIEHKEVVSGTTTDYDTDNTYNKKENETITSESQLEDLNLSETKLDDVSSTTANYDFNKILHNLSPKNDDLLKKSHTENEQSYSPQETINDNLESQNIESSESSDLSNSETEKNFLDTMYEFVNNLWSLNSNKLKNIDEMKDNSSPQETLIINENHDVEHEYCEKLNSISCPIQVKDKQSSQHNKIKSIFNEKYSQNENDLFSSLSDKIVDIIDIFICIVITAITSLIFAFGYYCICYNRNEQILLSKLNVVERSLLASNKESAVLKHELLETKSKLSSIEDNSFGSNDMIVMLKKEIEIYKEDKLKLQEQITTLEKELENAAEAGLELNKIVSELLSNQSGEDSIISSVEELQKQLNEQQNTILQINSTLAEKSKENSELQLLISEQVTKFEEEINSLKQKNKDLESDKLSLVTQIEELKKEHSEQISKILEEKSIENTRINEEIKVYRMKYEEISQKLQASEAKIQVLEECLSSIKKEPKLDIKNFLDVVNLKTENLVLTQERDSLKERLETESDTRRLLENRVKMMSEEIATLKQEYNQSEKEKLEAKTRLEVLSGYFKEKETQLQKELSIKEAMWLKQQGETTNTVERVRLMQDEIQSLRSQNDSLRAEIEAQNAAHKAQIASLENRAHETWLAARHSERKYEEARSEASALRRKLTSLGTNSVINETDMFNRNQNSTDGLMNQINNTSSPIHMESPGSPLLGNLPPPPPFLPPPFMAPPHPFMPLPPPLVPPSELRPPPLGRLMSPPPPPPHHHSAYSPNNVDDERHRYSPDNGRYSPDDSHYNYNTDLMSAYDTETDFSLPPSPQTRMTEGDYRKKDRIIYKEYSPSTDRNKKLKGTLSSGSEESFNLRKNKGKNKACLETE